MTVFSLETPRKILVTGATGFIGSYITQKLLDCGHFVTGLCRTPNPQLPPGYTRDMKELWKHPNFTLKNGNILDIETIREAMRGCEAVIHTAAYAKNYSPDKSIFTKMNVDGMRNVFTVAKELKIEKIVWTSTIVTFGPTRRGEIGDENMPRITEKYFTEYEETKSIAEKEALRWAKEGLPLTIVNPTRVYGPGQLSEGNAMAALIRDIDAGRMPVLLNYGINVGNYGYVEDIAEGHILALERGKIGERYILGGENASLKDLFLLIENVANKKHFRIPIWKICPMVTSYALLYSAKIFGIYPRITPGWVRTFMVDWTYSIEKARKELGYNSIPLEEGLRRTCDWLHELQRSES